MRHYDTVKTTKCHVEYEEGTTHIRSQVQINSHCAVPKLVWIEVQNTHHVQVSNERYKNKWYNSQVLQYYSVFFLVSYANCLYVD